jgi:hypothetical protein
VKYSEVKSFCRSLGDMGTRHESLLRPVDDCIWLPDACPNTEGVERGLGMDLFKDNNFLSKTHEQVQTVLETREFPLRK